MTMATRNPVILDKPEHWPVWIEEIRGAIPEETWVLIDPDLETHQDFRRNPSEPRIQEVNPAKATYVELTATERNVYDQMFKHYQVSLKRYEYEVKGHQDAKDLIRSRVSDAKSILLKGKDSAREWLIILKRATTASRTFIMFQAAQKYNASIRKPPTMASLDKWLTSWELAMAEAVKHNISEINAGKWLRDLAIVMKPLSDALYVVFMNSAIDERDSEPERYMSAGMRVREILRAASDVSKSRVTRGAAFATEFAGEAADDKDDHDEPDKDRTKSRKRQTRSSVSPSRNESRSKKRKVLCKACGLPSHKMFRCFYAFPELQPESFVPNEALVEKVAKALENTTLANEVETIRRKRQNKK
jgi:hypothetical protein